MSSASSDTTISRVLFLSPRVHVYMIPPLQSTRGHVAANWTRPPSRELFCDEKSRTCPRLRLLEQSPQGTAGAGAGVGSDKVTVTILLEDPAATGELFAAGPYTHPATVMQAVDSSRFFAITVVDQGRKAVLGVGFEERSEAFDFGVALQEARKVLGWQSDGNAGAGRASGSGSGGGGSKVGGPIKRDWSLKAGETLHVEVPKSAVRRQREEDTREHAALPATSGSGGFGGLLPPPPSAAKLKEERRRSTEVTEDMKKKQLAEMGFDDGEFGEFQ